MTNMTPIFLSIFIVLLVPLFKSKPLFFPNDSVLAVKHAFLISLIPLLFFLSTGFQTVVSSGTWFNCQSFHFTASLNLDTYSIIFTPLALLVTWSILTFALWYMSDEPNMALFFKYMLMFLMAMLVLVTANNIFQLFIGWEGVGIMSFLLIGWWRGRADANTAALQAVLYNRIGDVGFILLLAMAILVFDSWELMNIQELAKNNTPTPLLIGVILAAMSKSAQFGMHPWLPSAMEGPTPVSALLHSSTMVIAGVFLLVRFYPVIKTSPLALTTCLCLGALTSFFAALCAISQNDIKKIIAFSTSSQLGLMMVALGLGYPSLAFMHICMHAFFKAMLFLTAGSFIHYLDNEQDIRKMGHMYYAAPTTTAVLSTGCLALAGTPFLAGFYSKDAIIEALNTSNVNIVALSLTLAATSLTAVYSLRLIYHVAAGTPRFTSFLPIDETHPLINKAFKYLILGTLIAGALYSSYVITPTTPVLTMPFLTKTAALSVSLGAFLLGLTLTQHATTRQTMSPKPPIYYFSTLLGYFSHYFHRTAPKTILTFGQFLALLLSDQTWLEKVAPKLANWANMPLIHTTDNLQRGKIKLHMYLFILTLTIVLLALCFSNYTDAPLFLASHQN
uniref:NADH-ubiquinone oxidoreductase chain 5 n=1 Tax=Aspasma minima TaxID=181476 RepID=Q8HKQ1_ASPMI|nr:NADH dehydrogenase subunit 5 [Aspasma minima]BAC23797.1 NADH dehydrogenase subunit 5 [Aspasma minima]